MATAKSVQRRERYNSDPEYRATILRSNAAYRTRHPDRVASGARGRKLRSRYSIDPAVYDAMLAAQGGRCAICGTEECSTGRMFAVDHDAVTGQIRGLLCNRCNRGIGFLANDPARLDRAADYLRPAGVTPAWRPLPGGRVEGSQGFVGYNGIRLDVAWQQEWFALEPKLSPRLLAILCRSGFTVNDVRRTPDRVLLKVLDLGPTRLRELRAIVPEIP